MQLDFDLSRSKAPVVSRQEIETVVQFLIGRPWTTAAEILAALDIDERRLRAIAEQSEGQILSGPGCPGYKLLTSTAQLQEVDETANRLESQAKRMLARAYQIRRRAHALIR